MKHILLFFSLLVIGWGAQAQTPGDTIVVNTFNYTQTLGSGNRDTVINFPDLPGVTYEKIIMKYNMRCKNGLVSPGISGQTNIGCGEWDYSCNTYIHDSSRVDSVSAITPSHTIGGFSGTNYPYSTTATYNVFQKSQKVVTLNTILNEAQSVIGSGTTASSDVFKMDELGSKSQYMYTASELLAAGATAGDINGLLLELISGGTVVDFVKVKMKMTTNTNLSASTPEFGGWTEVYYQNTTFVTGSNRLQFFQPFAWDGASNVVVEFTYNDDQIGAALNFASHATAGVNALTAYGDFYPEFNGVNYYQSDTYKGISGTTDRTIEAWIKTSVNNKEIVSWGTDVTSGKWVFRIDASGALRVEVNGGYLIGTTLVDDNQYHHVACVFSGNNVNQVQLYLDGVLEAVSSTLAIAVNTNTSSGINMRVSRGVNNRYFDGIIDEVRVWEAALTPATILNWKHKPLDATHPNYAALKAYHRMNEGTGPTVADASGNGNGATVVGGEVWNYVRGEDLIKEFMESTERPNTTFLQGNYNLTVTPTIVNDTVYNTPNVVNEYAIVNNQGTVNNDGITSINTFNAWEATFNYVYDTLGAVVATVPVTPTGTINITDLTYYQRWPMKFEIMSFVTPYGINLDLGINGKTWTFDMTDYTPILKGLKRMTMERGGQRQEDMDIQFLFIVGTPERDVLDIREIWRTESRTYTTIVNDQYFAPVSVPLLAAGDKFKVRTSITGHGQEGEFIARDHNLNVNGGSTEFTWQVWKECAENPVYPQGGTWIFDRAGWCPGMATDVQQNDVTQYVSAGSNAMFDYGMPGASGDSRYIVSNQLVTYGPINHALDASITEIKQPTDAVEYARTNSICNEPIVVLKNTGSTTITSAKIKYWVNNVNNAQTFDWTGSISAGNSEDIGLPTPIQLWASLLDTLNVFHSEVTEVNGGVDQYGFNDRHETNFTIPEVLPSNMVIRFKTNLFGAESSYEVIDDQGVVVYAKSGMSNNTLYRDTISLSSGCYSFKVYDTDDDGLSFFANNDGNGYVRIYEVGGSLIKTFEPDFGDGIVYNFTVDFPLSYDEINGIKKLSVYPNPTNDELNISLRQLGDNVNLVLYDQLGKIVRQETKQAVNGIYNGKWDMRDLPSGIYVLSISDGKSSNKVKVVKN